LTWKPKAATWIDRKSVKKQFDRKTNCREPKKKCSLGVVKKGKKIPTQELETNKNLRAPNKGGMGQPIKIVKTRRRGSSLHGVIGNRETLEQNAKGRLANNPRKILDKEIHSLKRGKSGTKTAP